MKVDYSLYLVTDNTKAILGDRDILEVVEKAVKGGVTIVQLRDKTSETKDLISIARGLKKICSKHNVPFLVNDRVDVALAADADGVHIGQDDMNIEDARNLLGPDKIIGVTASSTEQALTAARAGADYLGLGTVYATPTKTNSKSIIGTSGVRNILRELYEQGFSALSTVCIGGLNNSNLQRVLMQASHLDKPLDGVALVSAVMAAKDPEAASADLLNLVHTPAPYQSRNVAALSSTNITKLPSTPADLLKLIVPLFAALAEAKPLCHNITNLVVQNFAANIALALGGSPIMSANGAEASDLAKLGGSLLLNQGSVTPESLANSLLATKAYNSVGGAIVFDPVGAGATGARREAVKSMLGQSYFSVIKGNESEILTVLGEQVIIQHGVDSASGSALTIEDKARIVKRLAARERCVILMTGKVDVLSDGQRTYAISNGDPILGEVTGTGCTLGTTIAAFAAVEKKRDEEGKGGDMLLATLAACIVFEVAAEWAAQRVNGPGGFVPMFIDEIYGMRKNLARGYNEWIDAAKVELVDV